MLKEFYTFISIAWHKEMYATPASLRQLLVNMVFWTLAIFDFALNR